MRIFANLLGRNRGRLAGLGLAAMSALGPSSEAGIINVVDGDFSVASAAGSVGGIVTSGSPSVQVGSGPWYGTYGGINLVAAKLAAPVITVGSGSGGVATIGGVGSLLGSNNGGYLSQTLSTSYASGTYYTLSADITTPSVLGASLFTNTGVGIALVSGGGTVLAQSDLAGAAASVTLLGGSTYRVSMTYQATSADLGTIGIRLFDDPRSLASANLLGTVSFDNLSLESSSNAPGTASPAAVPSPASASLLGLGLASLACFRQRSNRAA